MTIIKYKEINIFILKGLTGSGSVISSALTLASTSLIDWLIVAFITIQILISLKTHVVIITCY